jgi:hypothetical protein
LIERVDGWKQIWAPTHLSIAIFLTHNGIMHDFHLNFGFANWRKIEWSNYSKKKEFPSWAETSMSRTRKSIWLIRKPIMTMQGFSRKNASGFRTSSMPAGRMRFEFLKRVVGITPGGAIGRVWREKNIGWRLDHFFLPAFFKSQVNWVQQQPDVRGSDHCPVVLSVPLSPSL